MQPLSGPTWVGLEPLAKMMPVGDTLCPLRVDRPSCGIHQHQVPALPLRPQRTALPLRPSVQRTESNPSSMSAATSPS